MSELLPWMADFLDEVARYFGGLDNRGEDAAYWAHVQNAENCRKIAAAIRRPSPPRAGDDATERVARAICAADHHEWPKDDYSGCTQIRCYKAMARAAIAAWNRTGER